MIKQSTALLAAGYDAFEIGNKHANISSTAIFMGLIVLF